MPEMHLRQPVALGKPWFTYSACGTIIKNKECKNLRKQYIYQNKIASYKVLCNKAFNIAQFPKYDWYERGLA